LKLRERQQELEMKILSEYASKSADSKGRRIKEAECDVRTPYSRDRDRIIHCNSFRRLKEKTQVFISPEGDHYRTRLTHTLEASQIARTISRALRLNEDLTEAIALGHDLGHTPFGHAGERALDTITSFGFRHYEQSVRVVEKIERGHKGLNLCYETINGIKCHTKGPEAETMEGRVVKLSDKIAYINHDIEDAITAGVFSESMIPTDVSDILGSGKSKRITTLIDSLIENTREDNLMFGDEVRYAFKKLHRFMFDEVYLNTESSVKNEEKKVIRLISALFEYYMKFPESMPELYLLTAETESVERAVVDYISGMSDDYATHCFENLFIPKPWSLR